MAITTANSPEIKQKLDELYEIAADLVHQEGEPPWQLSNELRGYLDIFTGKAPQFKTMYTNLITCLVCKAVDPSIDCRYHRDPADKKDKVTMPVPAAGPDAYFSGRTVSEKAIAPWLREKDFVHAESGWQTRTFERPKPYALTYDENVGGPKNEWLHVLDEVQVKGQNPEEALLYLFYWNIQYREGQEVVISAPGINEISTIVALLEAHFNSKYKAKGASRLPVLAVYALYGAMMTEALRFQGKILSELKPHSAADGSTGATGDIEVFDGDRLFEAVEIKHNKKIDIEMVKTAFLKFRGHRIDRYYLLTTAVDCGKGDEQVTEAIEGIKRGHGCQVIVNGVLPTIRYWLRLLSEPSAFSEFYADALRTDAAIAYEHRERWN
jgi:DNA (cytosine-5)-methyltransferase 1